MTATTTDPGTVYDTWHALDFGAALHWLHGELHAGRLSSGPIYGIPAERDEFSLGFSFTWYGWVASTVIVRAATGNHMVTAFGEPGSNRSELLTTAVRQAHVRFPT